MSKPRAAIPRFGRYAGPALFSAGFRPFFLAAAIWAAVAIPIWLIAYETGLMPPSLLPPPVWHAHEMIYGFAAAAAAGFLFTMIPNWSGRMPLQGWPLARLVLLWLAGRMAVLSSAIIGAPFAAVVDLSFPIMLLAVMAREIVTGRNWRNLPMLAGLLLLLAGNLLVHLEALRLTATAQIGNRLGIATLLILIAVVGGRIVPSFTRTWLASNKSPAPPPTSTTGFDHAALAVIGVGLAAWALVPQQPLAPYFELAAGVAALLRLLRWRGQHTLREPMLLVLHLGYGWLAAGLLLAGLDALFDFLPQTTSLHALTIGAIGTMILAVMTRVSLRQTGKPQTAGPLTTAAYMLVTIAAILRLIAPVTGGLMLPILAASGIAWCVAYGGFAILYGPVLVQPSAVRAQAKPI